MKKIPFNKPPMTGNEIAYMQQAMANGHLSGNGIFTKKCEKWLENQLNATKVLLTSSCTASLEMAALLLDIQAGDEVIMPSYTFVSTANAFALRGAKIVFVDIRPDTMNLDERQIEQAITPNTKAIVAVHYAGVACEMDTIMAVAEKYGLLVVEDAAQGVLARYKGKALGTIGHIGCFSFHETKNYSAGGEGGAIVLNEPKFIERTEIIREKGTNRSEFFKGLADKYSWRDLGSSYLMSDLQAAYLYAQFENAEQIKARRLSIWLQYWHTFQPLAEQGLAVLPTIPPDCEHNAHIFYLKLHNETQRSALIAHLQAHGILAVFHYIPLHSSPAGQRFGRFVGEDNFTTQESEKLVRFPLFFNLLEEEVARVISATLAFFSK